LSGFDITFSEAAAKEYQVIAFHDIDRISVYQFFK
jgi:hypothetical protein